MAVYQSSGDKYVEPLADYVPIVNLAIGEPIPNGLTEVLNWTAPVGVRYSVTGQNNLVSLPSPFILAESSLFSLFLVEPNPLLAMLNPTLTSGSVSSVCDGTVIQSDNYGTVIITFAISPDASGEIPYGSKLQLLNWTSQPCSVGQPPTDYSSQTWLTEVISADGPSTLFYFYGEGVTVDNPWFSVNVSLPGSGGVWIKAYITAEFDSGNLVITLTGLSPD